MVDHMTRSWMLHLACRGVIVIATTTAVVFLWCFDPESIVSFPRCPFFVLTGLKCPGCGTLRALHAVLHFDFMRAFHLNPALFVAFPIIMTSLMQCRFTVNPIFSWIVLVAILMWWVGRNL